MSIRHLRAALAVRDEQSFVRAAARLGVVPSALTETIRQIEDTSGVVLFDRNTRPVGITEAGAVFLSNATRVVNLFDRALDELMQAGGVRRGRIVVAAAPSMIRHLLGPTLRRFRARHPGIEVVVHDDVGERIADMVRDGAADCGLGAVPEESADFDYVQIGEDRFGLVCHRSHRLAAREAGITLADIPAGEFIALQSGTAISQLLARAPNVPEALTGGAALQCYSTIAQLSLIAQNLGVGLLPELAASVLQTGELRFVPVTDLDLTRSIYLITRARTVRSPAAARFIGMLLSDLDGGRGMTPKPAMV